MTVLVAVLLTIGVIGLAVTALFWPEQEADSTWVTYHVGLPAPVLRIPRTMTAVDATSMERWLATRYAYYVVIRDDEKLVRLELPAADRKVWFRLREEKRGA